MLHLVHFLAAGATNSTILSINIGAGILENALNSLFGLEPGG